MSDSYKFGGMLLPDLRTMVRVIAEQWITADGANPPEFCREYLAGHTDAQIAAECIDAWDLGRAEPDVEEPSHMERHGYDAASLERAVADYRERFTEEDAAATDPD